MKLPMPELQVRSRAGLSFLTDEEVFAASGVRLGFSQRHGGLSSVPFDSLNLGTHVGDPNPQAVRENRTRLLEAAGLGGTQLITLNQVHGSEVLSVDSLDEQSLTLVYEQAQEGADGIVVGVEALTALLCFADCVPVIVVSPSGSFAVAHAGWRGALAGIPGKAVAALAELDRREKDNGEPSEYNAYIGPHIMAECYECGEEVCTQFVDRFGMACEPSPRHLDLTAAVSASLQEAGVISERICAAQVCTACSTDLYYSYRASGGVCGRHGAFAGRIGGR